MSQDPTRRSLQESTPPYRLVDGMRAENRTRVTFTPTGPSARVGHLDLNGVITYPAPTQSDDPAHLLPAPSGQEQVR